MASTLAPLPCPNLPVSGNETRRCIGMTPEKPQEIGDIVDVIEAWENAQDE
jgi:hypothetical protein